MDEKLQRTLYELEVGKKQMEELNRQGQIIEQSLSELDETVSALKDYARMQVGTQSLVPIGAGSYVRSKISDTDSVLVGVGAGFSVEKKIPDAVETLKQRREQLAKSLSQVNKTVGELGVRLSQLNSAAESMMSQRGPQQ